MRTHPIIIEYKFKKNDEIFIRHKYNGDISILYETANPFLAETLVASGIEKIFIYVRYFRLSCIYANKKYDNFVYHVVKIEVCPELKCANIYCLEEG